jgi:hypothetical protein
VTGDGLFVKELFRPIVELVGFVHPQIDQPRMDGEIAKLEPVED